MFKKCLKVENVHVGASVVPVGTFFGEIHFFPTGKKLLFSLIDR